MNATRASANHESPDHRGPPGAGAPSLVQRGARALLRAFGWTVDIAWPTVPRSVIIVYPHTSNWDFVVGYLAKLAAGIPVHFVGKHTLFRWPFGGLLRRMGGIPVNRRDAARFIPDLAAEMAARPWMWIALAPEGTRAYTDHWKSGFHRLARAADVPVGLAFIDWKRRRVGLRDYVAMTGDEEADLATLRAAYADKIGKRPEHASAIRFRAERR
jgi:1-acyl-sn-glycerol-3-phosphate acyltransferase